jgi:PAS domain S-box-containing protein
MKENYKILIADDEALWANLIKGIMEGHGYQVFVTTHAAEVVKLAISEDVDLILLDINFPDMSGLEICQTISSNPETEHISILLLTSQSDPSDLKRGLESGANDYVEKQSSSLELIARMQAVLRKRKKYNALLFLKSLLENSPYPVLTLKEEKITYINHKFAALLQHPGNEELLNLNISDLMHEDELEDFKKHLSDVITFKTEYEFPYKFLSKNGDYINLLVHMVYLDSKKGVALYCNTFI